MTPMRRFCLALALAPVLAPPAPAQVVGITVGVTGSCPYGLVV